MLYLLACKQKARNKVTRCFVRTNLKLQNNTEPITDKIVVLV